MLQKIFNTLVYEVPKSPEEISRSVIYYESSRIVQHKNNGQTLRDDIVFYSGNISLLHEGHEEATENTKGIED